jgi:hypothetical protein
MITDMCNHVYIMHTYAIYIPTLIMNYHHVVIMWVWIKTLPFALSSEAPARRVGVRCSPV